MITKLDSVDQVAAINYTAANGSFVVVGKEDVSSDIKGYRLATAFRNWITVFFQIKVHYQIKTHWPLRNIWAIILGANINVDPFGNADRISLLRLLPVAFCVHLFIFFVIMPDLILHEHYIFANSHKKIGLDRGRASYI